MEKLIIFFLVTQFTYANSNLQQSDILAFDPSVACDILAVNLEKMKAALDEKKIILTTFEESLRSAATPSIKYGNILLEYHRTLGQFNSMKKDYDRLVLVQEKHCMPDQDKQSMN